MAIYALRYLGDDGALFLPQAMHDPLVVHRLLFRRAGFCQLGFSMPRGVKVAENEAIRDPRVAQRMSGAPSLRRSTDYQAIYLGVSLEEKYQILNNQDVS
jgi:hypothetical protein